MRMVNNQFEIALSFAGEHRNIARSIWELLNKEVNFVFYDYEERSDFVGKYGIDYFMEVYSKAILCVPLLSKEYYKKSWTFVERVSMERRLIENLSINCEEWIDFIVPFVLDESKPRGIFQHLNPQYENDPQKIAGLVLKKYNNIKEKFESIPIPNIENVSIFIDLIIKYLSSKCLPLNVEILINGNEFGSSIFVKKQTNTYELRFSESCFVGNPKAIRLDGYLDFKKDYALSMDIILNKTDSYVLNLGDLCDETSSKKMVYLNLLKKIMKRVEYFIYSEVFL